MIDVAYMLLKVFAFAIVSGLGVSLLIVPSRLLRGPIVFLIVPCLGLLQLAILDGYLIASSRPLSTSIQDSVIVGAVALVAAVLLKYLERRHARRSVIDTKSWMTRPFHDALRAMVRIHPATLLLFIGAGLIILSPTLRANAPTTPYRIGIDQVGYAETAQYLLEGGTLQSGQRDLLESLNITKLKKAEAHNLLSLNFGRYVDSEFLLKALRWGFPGVLASLAILTGSPHVYRVEFVSLIFCYLLIAALSYRIAREAFYLPHLAALASAIAIAFNCNLINVYYEGQLAQIFAEPFILLVLFSYVILRRLEPRTSTRANFERYRFAALLAFLIGGLFFAYNEALVLVFAYMLAVVFVDLLGKRQFKGRAFATLACGSFVGGVLAFPISSHWVRYTFANLAGLSHAGFWQPHWGSLAEIVGLQDMYGHAPYMLLQRSSANEVLTMCISFALAVVLAGYLTRCSRRVDVRFWLVSLLLIGAVYVKSKYLDGILNYPYMKLYTLLLPLAGSAVLASLSVKHVRRWPVITGSLVAAAFICITGMHYIWTYLNQSAYVTSDMFALYDPAVHRRFGDVAIETARRQPGIKDFMLTPLVTLNWINESDGPKYIGPFLNLPVSVLLWKSDLYRPATLARMSRDIIYENPSFAVVKLNRSLREICVRESGKYRVDELSDAPSDSWARLPGNQCGYRLGESLREKLNS